jgi:glycolate oxidase FAD binding subunit
VQAAASPASVLDVLRAVAPVARPHRHGDPLLHDTAPAAVIDCTSDAEAARVLAMCAAHGWRVAPMGAGTWMGRAATAGRPDAALHDLPVSPCVLLSTRALTGIDQYRPEDLTITVGAGTTLQQLDAVVGQNRQWLPHDPPRLPGATIGAIIATAAGGPLRARYGLPRDQVLGLDIATGDGRLLHFGGAVVKNVAGYDMVRPIVGSYGSLGIITRVSLRLRPLHAVDETVLCTASENELPPIVRALNRIRGIAALEILSPALARDVGASAAASGAEAGGAGNARWLILARLHGHEADVAGARNTIGRAVGAADARLTDATVWSRLSAAEASAPVYFRLSALPTRLDSTLEVANRFGDRMLGDRARVAVHSTEGIVRVFGSTVSQLSQDAESVWSAAVAEMLNIDGTAVSVDGPVAARPAVGRRADIEDGIRRLFDPADILIGGRR